MNKVLIRGTAAYESVGVRAMAICTMEIIKQSIPSCEFIIFSSDPPMDHKFYDKYDLNLRIIPRNGNRRNAVVRLMRVAAWSSMKNLFNLDLNYLIKNDDIIKITKECDIVVDMLGDGFSYDLGSLGGNISPISHSINILLACALGKDVILFPQSIGPFKNELVKSFAKFSLNKAKAIAVRERVSMDYLKKIGVKSSILHLTGDTAFILAPAPYERVKELIGDDLINENKHFVGINISQMLAFRSSNDINTNNSYIELMARFADYLVEDLDVIVILLPHALFPREMANKNGRNIEDDSIAVNDVYKLIKNKNSVLPLTDNELSAADLKGVIGQCDMFIGGRMHSVIAAISLCIPTIAISYSIKAPGIMDCVGLKEYVCNFKTITYEELVEKTHNMWINQKIIHNKMEDRIVNIKNSVWFNGKLVKKFLHDN